MRLLHSARAFGAAFALVLLGFLTAQGTQSLFWNNSTPTTLGPWLGDPNINVGQLWTAYTTSQGLSYHAGLSVSQTSAQANCTQLDNSALQEVKTSASTGYICLPVAYAGRDVLIANPTTQTIDIYSSAVSFTPGTTDTINGTAGTTPYTSLTTGKNTECFSPANGAWYCSTSN
jgi:hypothetical protein